jgi:hypothetical protein
MRDSDALERPTVQRTVCDTGTVSKFIQINILPDKARLELVFCIPKAELAPAILAK